MKKQELDEKYQHAHDALEEEYFEVVGDHRQLRSHKDPAKFNRLHGELWANHHQKLLDLGLVSPEPLLEPVRDLGAELDALAAEFDALATRFAALEGRH